MASQNNESSCIWCNLTSVEVGIQITLLSTVSVIGIVGNLLFISSILFAKTANKLGNMFLINLAIADLVVTGVCFPPVIANVANDGKNVMPKGVCNFLGFTLVTSCTCSMGNLFAIAVNRYVAVVHRMKYKALFSKRNVYLMVVFIWIWAILIESPTALGWTNLMYDEKVSICAWDDAKSRSYSFFVIITADFLPAMGIAIFYFKLYKAMKSRGEWIRTLGSNSTANLQNPRTWKTEIAMMKTLLITVGFFMSFWFPYGIVVIYGSDKVQPWIKKVVALTAMSNSSVNFIIYGITNPVYRKGYKNLLRQLLFCKGSRKTERRGNAELQPVATHAKEGPQEIAQETKANCQTISINHL